MVDEGNVLTALPDTAKKEIFEDVLRGDGVRIERIVSQGQVTPEGEWYDQDEHEWVMVLSGAARLLLQERQADAGENVAIGAAAVGEVAVREVTLGAGDYINLPAHCRHRVSWTDPEQQTVWLAVFYR